MRANIAVIGAGSWGSALAIMLARQNLQVRLWDHDSANVQRIARDRENKRYLPDCHFPDNIALFTDLAATIAGVTDILIVVPSHAFRGVLVQLHAIKEPQQRYVWATKGFDPTKGELLMHVVREICGDDVPIAVLSGPSFALEVGNNIPTAVTLACQDETFRNDLVNKIHSDNFRLYLSEDLIGVQLCGALKNVLAIATGISEGLGFGANTQAALITRGLAEMTRLGLAMGAKATTFTGLAGLGDLVLTCTDNQSRNRRFGLAIGKGIGAEQAMQTIGQVVEGAQNAAQAHQLAAKFQVELPIVEQVYAVLAQQITPQQAVHYLLSREPKHE